MKSIITRLSALAVLLAACMLPVRAEAQYQGPFAEICAKNPSATVCQENNKPQDIPNNSIWGENGVITRVTRLVSWVVGVVSVIMIMFGGFRYVLSGGDSNKVNTARMTIIYSIIGLLIAIFAQVIIAFVIGRV